MGHMGQITQFSLLYCGLLNESGKPYSISLLLESAVIESVFASIFREGSYKTFHRIIGYFFHHE